MAPAGLVRREVRRCQSAQTRLLVDHPVAMDNLWLGHGNWGRWVGGAARPRWGASGGSCASGSRRAGRRDQAGLAPLAAPTWPLTSPLPSAWPTASARSLAIFVALSAC